MTPSGKNGFSEAECTPAPKGCQTICRVSDNLFRRCVLLSAGCSRIESAGRGGTPSIQSYSLHRNFLFYKLNFVRYVCASEWESKASKAPTPKGSCARRTPKSVSPGTITFTPSLGKCVQAAPPQPRDGVGLGRHGRRAEAIRPFLGYRSKAWVAHMPMK